MPTDMRALQDFEEPDKLKIHANDIITVIEGRSACHLCNSCCLDLCLNTAQRYRSYLKHYNNELCSLFISLWCRAENYWWRGQNRQTLKVGQFPRNVVTSVAGLSAQDISRPLKHSFIHTGHGDTDPHRSWGAPDKIDE